MENQVTVKKLKEIEVNGVAIVYLEITSNNFTYRTVQIYNDNSELATIYIENLMTDEHLENMRNNVVNKLEFTISTTSWGALSPDELQVKVDRYQETIATVQKLKLELDRYQLEIITQEQK